MGELAEQMWAVISERGREASGLTYKEAAQLIGRLKDEKVSGLCVVTTAAAERLARSVAANPHGHAAQTQSKRAAALPSSIES